ALGAVNPLDVLGLVPGEDVADFECADDVILAGSQSDGLAGLERTGHGLVHGKADRNGPGVTLAAGDDSLFVQDLIESGLIHRSSQRAEAAIAKAIEARQVCIADWDFLERSGVLDKVGYFRGGDGTVDGFAQTAMRWNQIGHCWLQGTGLS